MTDKNLKVTSRSYLRLERGVSPDKMNITPQEGFLLSRITDDIQISDLLSMSPFDSTTTAVMIKKLISLGIIAAYNDDEPKQQTNYRDEPESVTPEAREKIEPPRGEEKAEREQPKVTGAGWDYKGFIFPLGELKQAPMLDDEIKRLTIYLDTNLDYITLYDILDIPFNASPKEIKDSYYKASKMFHPDMYFGKNIGPYKARMTRIYKKINEAIEILQDSAKRQEYDKKLVKLGIANPSQLADGKFSYRQDDHESDEERKRRLERRLRNSSGIMERLNRARELYEHALAQKKAGNLVDAYNTIKIAVTYDPKNETYRAFDEEISKTVMSKKAEEVLKMGEEAEKRQDPNYISIFEEAARKFTKDARIQFKYAQINLQVEDYRGALQFAEKAAKLAPQNVDILMFLGNIQEKFKKFNLALETYEKILKIDEKHKIAKKKVKDLKQVAAK